MAGQTSARAARVVLDRCPDVSLSQPRICYDPILADDKEWQLAAGVLLPLSTFLDRRGIVGMGGVPVLLRGPALRRIGTPAHHSRRRATSGVRTLGCDEAASAVAGRGRPHTLSA